MVAPPPMDSEEAPYLSSLALKPGNPALTTPMIQFAIVNWLPFPVLARDSLE